MKLELLSESSKKEYKSAVAIVSYRDKWLLGLATQYDDRSYKWCFPGGGIKSGETPEEAAVREAYEELGVRSKMVSGPYDSTSHHGVAFYHCRVNSEITPKTNNEFSHAGWFRKRDMRGLKLYKNVLQLIARVR